MISVLEVITNQQPFATTIADPSNIQVAAVFAHQHTSRATVRGGTAPVSSRHRVAARARFAAHACKHDVMQCRFISLHHTTMAVYTCRMKCHTDNGGSKSKDVGGVCAGGRRGYCSAAAAQLSRCAGACSWSGSRLAPASRHTSKTVTHHRAAPRPRDLCCCCCWSRPGE